jgi:hypothetical protein
MGAPVHFRAQIPRHPKQVSPWRIRPQQPVWILHRRRKSFLQQILRRLRTAVTPPEKRQQLRPEFPVNSLHHLGVVAGVFHVLQSPSSCTSGWVPGKFKENE